MINQTENILVIKLGAFGDFIQAMGPMAAIRRHHPAAHITLLTTEKFVSLARESPYCDAVWTDTRPRWSAPGQWARLARRLRGGHFTRVYDLQNNDRTARYLWLFGARRPEWVGAAFGASHRNTDPARIAGHAFDGHRQTLSLAGIHDVTPDPLDWVKSDVGRFAIPSPFILLVPGSTPNRPEKRWPVAGYAELAQHLAQQGYTPVIIGTEQEAALGRTIREQCPAAINLCGQTTIPDLVGLARAAAGAIGNDTGPMHLIAPTGCPVIVLFSRHSNPKRHAPVGPAVRSIQRNELADFTADDFFKEMGGEDLKPIFPPKAGPDP